MKLMHIELILVTLMLFTVFMFSKRAKHVALDASIDEDRKEYSALRHLAVSVGGFTLIVMFCAVYFNKGETRGVFWPSIERTTAAINPAWQFSREKHVGDTQYALPAGEYTVGPALRFTVDSSGRVEGSGNFYSFPFTFETTLKYNADGFYIIDDEVKMTQSAMNGKATFRLTITEKTLGNTYSNSQESTDLVYVQFANGYSPHYSVNSKEYLMKRALILF